MKQKLTWHFYLVVSAFRTLLAFSYKSCPRFTLVVVNSSQ